MQTTGNTILITGGNSGIGRGIAEAFHKLGNRVIIAGRSQAKIDDTLAANPGMVGYAADMGQPKKVLDLAHTVLTNHPQLNAVFHVAGIMQNENLQKQAEPLNALDDTVATNFTGVLRLNAALLPHLLKQPRATVMTVTSGLAFVPLAMTPTYSATKAAIHSFTQSLRYQLKGTNVQVMELIPPYVQTTLMGDRQKQDPNAMPLDDYVREVMEILTTQPDETEICVQRVLPLRNAADGGREKFEGFFNKFNDQMFAARASEFK